MKNNNETLLDERSNNKRRLLIFIIISLLIHFIFFLVYSFNGFKYIKNFIPSIREQPPHKKLETKILFQPLAELKQRFGDSVEEKRQSQSNPLLSTPLAHYGAQRDAPTLEKKIHKEHEEVRAHSQQKEFLKEAPKNFEVQTHPLQKKSIEPSELKKVALASLFKKQPVGNQEKQKQRPQNQSLLPPTMLTENSTNSRSRKITFPLGSTLDSTLLDGNSAMSRQGDNSIPPTLDDYKIMSYGNGVAKIIASTLKITTAEFFSKHKDAPLNITAISFDLDKKGIMISCTLESDEHYLFAQRLCKAIKKDSFFPQISPSLKAENAHFRVQILPFSRGSIVGYKAYLSLEFY